MTALTLTPIASPSELPPLPLREVGAPPEHGRVYVFECKTWVPRGRPVWVRYFVETDKEE